MNCPECKGKSEVTHTRTFPDYDRRRRVCRECGRVFITYETLRPPGERYPMGHPWTMGQPWTYKAKAKPEHRYCEYNQAVVCEEGNRCATCGWNPARNRTEGKDGKT